MSVASARNRSAGIASDNRDLFRDTFVIRVHQLLHMGYQRLEPKAFRSKQETEITGELVRAIRECCESTGAPSWACHFAIHDDPPQNTKRRLGKRRPRVDIELERTQRGPHPRFRFEAKRLRSRATPRAYLGRTGLGCFIHCDYAHDQPYGGMLGYVQAGSVQGWLAEIEDRLAKKPAAYSVLTRGCRGSVRLSPRVPPVHVTQHNRVSKAPITIYHTLLRFS